MKESAISATSPQNSEILESTHPIAIGSTMGGTTAMGLAILYAFALVPYVGWMNFFDEFDISHDILVVISNIGMAYMAMAVLSFMVLIPTLIVGVPTAAILGLIGGALLGLPFLGAKQRLSRRNVLIPGMIRSLPLATMYSLCMRWMFGWLRGGLATEWVLWIVPGMIAFFGFWWVTVKINAKLPTC